MAGHVGYGLSYGESNLSERQDWRGPLSGVRLADFCWWGVGAIATRVLADFGADVVKIESHKRRDMTRNLPPFPGRTILPGQIAKTTEPNKSGYFHNNNRNKRSLALDMKEPAGREIVNDLIGVSDLVTENFRPGVMEKWGYTFESLQGLKPDIVWASLSGHGQTGPAAGYGTNGPVVQALSGLTATAGLPGREPSGYGMSYMDQIAGYYGSIAMMQGLYQRNATGRPQRVEVSSIEAGINLLGPIALQLAATGRPYREGNVLPPGNRSVDRPAAPHGVFPTNEDDRWIAIAVFTEDEWSGLVQVMGSPQWCGRPEFSSQKLRIRNSEDLERRLSEWTRTQERYVLMSSLQAVGVSAGVVQTAQDRNVRDPQIRITNPFPVLPNATIGEWPVQAEPFHLSQSPQRAGQHGGPRLGSSTRLILTELLNRSDKEIDELVKAGVVFCDE